MEEPKHISPDLSWLMRLDAMLEWHKKRVEQIEAVIIEQGYGHIFIPSERPHAD